MGSSNYVHIYFSHIDVLVLVLYIVPELSAGSVIMMDTGTK